MPKKTAGYIQLALKQEDYDKLRKEWKLLTKGTEQSFTQWATNTLEVALSRIRFLQKNFPNIKFVSLKSQGLYLIEDTGTGEIIKVWFKEGRLECSAKENKESYILYASLHPLMSL